MKGNVHATQVRIAFVSACLGFMAVFQQPHRTSKGKRNFFVTIITESDKNVFHSSISEIDADGVVGGDEHHHKNNTQIIPLIIKGTQASAIHPTVSILSSSPKPTTFSKTTAFESLRIAAFGSSKTWEPEVNIYNGTP
jgi:hypothetical protein